MSDSSPRRENGFSLDLSGLSALRERDSAKKFFSQRLAQREELIQLSRQEFPFQVRENGKPAPFGAATDRLSFIENGLFLGLVQQIPLKILR
jgi:hypothetical protein